MSQIVEMGSVSEQKMFLYKTKLMLSLKSKAHVSVVSQHWFIIPYFCCVTFFFFLISITCIFVFHLLT